MRVWACPCGAVKGLLGIGSPVDGHSPFSQRIVQCELRRPCKAAGFKIKTLTACDTPMPRFFSWQG
jgi:hypothetical protein